MVIQKQKIWSRQQMKLPKSKVCSIFFAQSRNIWPNIKLIEYDDSQLIRLVSLIVAFSWFKWKQNLFESINSFSKVKGNNHLTILIYTKYCLFSFFFFYKIWLLIELVFFYFACFQIFFVFLVLFRTWANMISYIMNRYPPISQST